MVGVDGGGTRGLEMVEVFDAMDQGTNGAENRAARAAETDKFSSCPVLLGGKFEGNEGGRVQVSVRAGVPSETALVDDEVDVADAEGGRFTAGRTGVFSGSKEEEEG